jgi:hypothetical protein
MRRARLDAGLGRQARWDGLDSASYQVSIVAFLTGLRGPRLSLRKTADAFAGCPPIKLPDGRTLETLSDLRGHMRQMKRPYRSISSSVSTPQSAQEYSTIVSSPIYSVLATIGRVLQLGQRTADGSTDELS